MPYFTDPSGSLHFLESADNIWLLPPGCVETTNASAQQVLQARAAATTPAMSVTPMQAYAALEAAGLLPQVVAFIDAPTTPPLVRLAWLGATEFRRDSLLVMNAAIVLGLTNAQLDNLFTAAAAVPT